MNTKVSCVIPSYKRANTLKRAIDSVLAQTYSNIEVLIVDDNIEGDEYSIALHKIINEYKDNPRVIFVSQPKHINGAEARNAGIRAAHGEWIAFLDDDDEWLPTKIEKQMAALYANPECMGASCYYDEFVNGKLVHSCPPYTTDNLNMKVFCREVAMYTPTLVLRKDKLLEFGAFDNKLQRHQDLQLLVEFTHRNKMLVVQEVLVKVHADSLINRPSLEKFVDVKKKYFKSVDNVFRTYSKSDQHLIKVAHYYEIVFYALKTKNFSVAIKYFIKAGFSFKAVKMLAQRMKDKKYMGDAK